MSRREIFLSYPFLIQAERKPTCDEGDGLGVLGAHSNLFCSVAKAFDLNLIPRSHVEMRGCGGICLPSSAGEVETGGALELTSQQV